MRWGFVFLGIFLAQGGGNFLAGAYTPGDLRNMTEEAREQLREDGWTQDADGNWRDSSGRPLASVTEHIGGGEQADNVAAMQEMNSMQAMGKGVMAAAKSAGCCAAVPVQTGCCVAFGVAAAGLFGIGATLGGASKKNRDTARHWRGQGPAGSTHPPPPGPPGPPGPPDPSDTPVVTPPPDPTIRIPTPGDGTQPVVLTKPGIEKFLEENDMSWDPDNKTLTMPDGQTFTAGQDTSGLSVPQSVSSKFNRQAEQVENQIKDHYAKQQQDQEKAGGGKGLLGKTAGYRGGGGFKGYGEKRSSRSPDSDSLSSLSGSKNNRDPSSTGKNHLDKVSGMSVRHGTDRIGVSEDNIFAIMHRQYQAQRGKKFFSP